MAASVACPPWELKTSQLAIQEGRGWLWNPPGRRPHLSSVAWSLLAAQLFGIAMAVGAAVLVVNPGTRTVISVLTWSRKYAPIRKLIRITTLRITKVRTERAAFCLSVASGIALAVLATLALSSMQDWLQAQDILEGYDRDHKHPLSSDVGTASSEDPFSILKDLGRRDSLVRHIDECLSRVIYYCVMAGVCVACFVSFELRAFRYATKTG
jgi:hypothetical protein